MGIEAGTEGVFNNVIEISECAQTILTASSIQTLPANAHVPFPSLTPNCVKLVVAATAPNQVLAVISTPRSVTVNW